MSFFYLFDVKQMQNNTIVGENKMCLRQAALHDIHSYSKIKRCGCCVSIRKENIPHDTPPTQQKNLILIKQKIINKILWYDITL